MNKTNFFREGSKVPKKEVEELKEEINRLKPILEKTSIDDVVKNIKEDRDSR